MNRARERVRAITASLADLPSGPTREVPEPARPVMAAIGGQIEDMAKVTGEAYQRLKAELETAVAEGRMIVELPAWQIHDTRFRDRHPRGTEDPAFQDLVASIRRHGQLAPVALRPAGEGGYEVVYGHRRVAACRLLDRAVRAVVLPHDDKQLVAAMLVENQARADLSPIERAQHYQALLNSGLFTRGELAELLGVSRPQITNILQLTKLPQPVLSALGDPRELSLGSGMRLVQALERAGDGLASALDQVATRPGDANRKAVALAATLERGDGTALERSITIADARGRRFGRLTRSGSQLVLRFQPGLDGDLVREIADRLPELYEAGMAQRRART